MSSSSSNRKRRRSESNHSQQNKRIKMSSSSSNLTTTISNGIRNHCNGNGNSNNNNNNSYFDHNTNNTIYRLSHSEIVQFCSCNNCDIFIDFIYYTNGHSLYNILTLQHNLKFENITCCAHNCSQINNGKFYICLDCIYYCCGEHLLSHTNNNNNKKHYLYYELSTQSIYCIKCGSYHTSLWTDSMILSFIELAKKRLTNSNSDPNANENEIECNEMEIINNNNFGIMWKQFDCIRDNGTLGIRGTYNLGNTCYMAAVLQIFMHNSLLRNYYLSSYHSLKCKHDCKIDKNKNKNKTNKSKTKHKNKNNNNNNNNGCVECEIELLFNDFYCGINASGVSISNFIGCVWRDTDYKLAGQEMHDCHEFFISITQLMHKYELATPGFNKNEILCQCIIHTTFRGLWSSELKCLNAKCLHISETSDMFMEINLQPRKLKNKSNKSNKPNKSKRNNGNQHKINNKTIEEALKDYMESEPMPDYKCNDCGEKMCQKFMSIKELPQTLCLHLKRFEADELSNNESYKNKSRSPSVDSKHKNKKKSSKLNKSNSKSLSPNVVTKNNRSRRKNQNNNNYKYEYNNNSNNSKLYNIELNNLNNSLHGSNSNNSLHGLNGNNSTAAFGKIGEFVQFPVDELLDLSQFINEKYKNKKRNKKKYRLKSMIIHSGVLSSGHYVCYIRKQNQWFFCDDNAIVASSSDWVKKRNAYMLFYEAQ